MFFKFLRQNLNVTTLQWFVNKLKQAAKNVKNASLEKNKKVCQAFETKKNGKLFCYKFCTFSKIRVSKLTF